MSGPDAPVKVWVLDEIGYDQRGGIAQVFSTPELAKAAVPYVKEWVEDDDGDWREVENNSLATICVIQAREVDAK